MNAIEQGLRETFGLDLSVLGANALPRAVHQRLRRLGLKTPDELERLLEAFPAQWLDLVEEAVVPETWFFREPHAFAALGKLVHEQWLPQNPAGLLRLLSVPCASGEEPYSIVMALLDAGMASERFTVEAMDLSPTALNRARQGVYGKNAFRAGDLSFRQRYFRASSAGFALNPAIRRRVHFRQGNILDWECQRADGSYDIIFCRNLLIYLTPNAQRTVLEKMARLLAPGGFLFLGPAELALATDFGFDPANIPMAFACRRPKPVPPARQVRPETTRRRAVFAASPILPPTSPGLPLNRNFERPIPKPEASIPQDLEEARRLADAGRLNEAGLLCQAHLRRSQTSAYAYYLLGLVRDAAGDADASEYYRKALYLEPNHYETLLQLALLAQRSGDEAAALNFRRRAARLAKR